MSQVISLRVRRFACGAAGIIAFASTFSFACAQDCGEPVDFGFEVQSSIVGLAADCAVAVGSSSILATTNAGLWLFDREGTQIAFETMDEFFDGGFDTVCVYDGLSERYFVLTIHFPDLRLAVSKTSNPDLDPANWYFFDYDPPGNDSADYPELSVGEDHVFASFILNGSPVGRAFIGFAAKAGLLNGEHSQATWFAIDPIDGYVNGPARAIAAFHSSDEIAPFAYFITELRKDAEQSDKVRLYAVNTGDTPPSLTHFDLEVDPYWGAPLKVAVPDNGEVTCNWNFNKGPVYRNDSAWATFAIGPDNPSEEPKTAKARWMEIAMNGWPVSDFDPTVVQSGTNNPGSGISAFYPTLHVDDDKNMAIAWNQCSATAHVSIQRAIRKHYDEEGTLRTPLLLIQSTSSPSGNSPWADYTEMDEDPEFPGVMWSHLMWFEGTSTRKTWLARTDLNQSLPLTMSYFCQGCQPDEIARGTYVKLSVTGAAPGAEVRWYYSVDGCGSTYIALIDATLGIANPYSIETSTATSAGYAEKNFTVPANFPLGEVHVQAGELQNTSEIVRREVIE